ncbi:MAG TPA: hypothetical protein VE778_05520 [Candidatus Bathyarchaeia archaeon]|nr:hypothetical protein [Candidatus Bathyarchaeia archaeon]
MTRAHKPSLGHSRYEKKQIPHRHSRDNSLRQLTAGIAGLGSG